MNNLPLGADFESDAPWNDTGRYIYCELCNCMLQPHEQEDPMIIDHDVLCDMCAEKLITLKRFDPVSEKTKKLVAEVDKRNYQIAWVQMCNKIGRQVKHI